MMKYNPDKPHSAAETRKALRDVFTDAELFKLSDALLAAISNNVKASACITSREAREALTKEIDLLAALNKKLCAAMYDDEDKAETADGRPAVLIHVYGGMVQAVYSNIPGATCEVYDADTEEYDDGPDAEFNDLRNRPEYKMIW